MAGDEIVKSSKPSFMNVSPKPKQASILSFFGTQKQQTINSSPLCNVTQAKKSPIIEYDNEPVETENIPSEMFNEPIENKFKKVCIPEKNIKICADSYDKTQILVPRILNELNEAAVNDFDLSESSCGRYHWLIDIKDINGRKKGNNLFYI